MEYLSKLQKTTAFNEKIDDNLLLAITVNGLKPDIGRIIINKGPKMFVELRYATSIADIKYDTLSTKYFSS